MLEGNFQVQAPPPLPPPGSLYLEGRFNKGFLRYEFGRLIFGGAYFRNSTVLGLFEMLASLSSIKSDETFYVKGFTLPW